MNPKERHYWTQLRAALTAGQWRSATPAKTPNGYTLSWAELFRKFNKHCSGFQDVAEVASQTRALAQLLLEVHSDDDEESELRDEKVPPHPNTDTRRRGELGIESDVVLEGTHLEQASSRFDALKGLKSSNCDTLNLALAYYAFALGKPQECISLLDRVPDLLQFQNHIPVIGSVRSAATLAPSSYAPSLASYTGSFTSLVDNVVPEVRDGRGWAMVETFRSLCLQGMSRERLSPLEPQKALQAYSNAIPLFSSLRSEIIPKSSGKLDFTAFHQLRELWRWVERLLWRAVVLSSRTADLQSQGQPECQLWQWLDHYSSCSAYWPPNFRTVHRSTVYSLHMRALVLKNGGLSHRISPQSLSPSLTSASTSPTQSDSQSSAPQNWIHSARSIVQDYRAILTASTKFPRAGQRNMEVENFVDLCVAIWEAHGAVGGQAGWVIEILWWATRLTFNSSRVLRHLTRLLYLAGDLNLAKRTLRQYIQVVGKAYETSKQGVGEDKDTDGYWVDTLVFGARMLLKTAGSRPGLEGVEDVREAGNVLEKARTRLNLEDKPLLAKVLLSEGIYWSLLAIKGQEPLKRSSQLEKAHTVLQQSLLAQTMPSGYYHLALSYARRGGPAYDLEKAIESAGHAIAGQPEDVRYWHLLGILLTGAEKWAEAIEILERGAEFDEDEDYGDEDNSEECQALSESKDALTVTPSDVQTLVVPGAPTIKATDFLSEKVPGADVVTVKPPKTRPKGVATTRGKTPMAKESSPVPLLEPDATEIPPAETLLKAKELDFEDYPATKTELFEWHLQLRMTQVALMEIIEGAEGAEAGWLEIFSWVAERKGPMNSTDQSVHPRQSLEGPQRSTDQLSQIPTANQAAMHSQHLGAHDVEKKVYPGLGAESAPPLSSEGTNSLVPIPITISPATPDREEVEVLIVNGTTEAEKERERPKKDKDRDKKHGSDGQKRSTSLEQENKTKKVQKIIKNQVHKGRAGITAVSRKIGRNGGLRRSNSTPNFHAVLRQTTYQASSIHSRRRISSILHLQDRATTQSPPPPAPPSALPPPTKQDFKLNNDRLAKENRLLSDLWLMSAATFRRLGKIDQAKGAIQEAEIKDQTNPNVWVQLGLYYTALGHYQYAVDTLQKALFISPDDVPATVHLSKLYLDPEVSSKLRPSSNAATSPSASTASIARDVSSSNPDVDLAAGILAYLTKGRGWDVPEAWYYLAKAYGMQGRKEKERETLKDALFLSEKRGVRDIELALGWCT